MTHIDKIFDNFYLSTQQQSGIVVYIKSGQAIICNWAKDRDLPFFLTNAPAEFQERLYVSDVSHIRDIAAEIDLGCIIYDRHGDAQKLHGIPATAYIFTTANQNEDIFIVYVPEGWV